MKLLLVLALAAALPALAQTSTNPPLNSDGPPVSSVVPGDTVADISEESSTADANINARYTVQSVGLLSLRRYRLSRSLLDEMEGLVGAHFNSEIFQSLAQRISSELHGYRVVFKLARGTDPGYVRVNFEVNGPSAGFDLDFPKLMYSSRQGGSGETDAVLNSGSNTLTFGALTDGDSMIERVSGFRARYDRWDVVNDRVHLSFEFDSYHEQYNPATLAAAAHSNDLGALYSSRRNFEPTATILLAGPLTWTFGLSFEQLKRDLPAARTESANAIVNTLRYDRHWVDSGSGNHRFSAGYSLRAATSFLGSAYSYTRHMIDAGYHWKRGRQQVDTTVLAGAIAGNAPLYDRFVLGTGATLRGWDKYSLDALGGTRVVYGSAGYGYRFMRLFYDTGAIWDRNTRPQTKKSAGIGVKVEGILLALAFPLRGVHMEPVFIAGMNF